MKVPPNSIARSAQIRSRLDALVIDNPRAEQVNRLVEYLVEHGAAQGTGPKRCGLLIGPSQVGKTVLLNTCASALNKPELIEQRQRPALYVVIKPNVSTKGVCQNILTAIAGDDFNVGSLSASENVLLERAYVLLRRAKTKLLILDEAHQVAKIGDARKAWDVGELFKTLLLDGPCPVIMAGLEEAKAPFLANMQLSQRSEPIIHLPKLDVHVSQDRDLFLHFITAYIRRAEELSGLVNIRASFDKITLLRIIELADGVLGRACNFIKGVIQTAIEADRDHLTQEDFRLVAERSFVANQLCHTNPFILTS